jgi:hypothetical protein
LPRTFSTPPAELACGDEPPQAVLPGFPATSDGLGADAAEDVTAHTEEAVRAVAREELVAELFLQRDLTREHVGRQQPLDDVVVASVAVASREAEHARDGVRLEHGADGVRRYAEPVGRRPALGLEVERRQRALGADALEHAPGHVGVLGEIRAPGSTRRPRKVAHGNERGPLLYASKISRRS